MTDSDQSEVDRGVDESMRLFQKAQVGHAAAINVIQPARVLVVLDGSPQDATSIAAANELREQFNTESLVLDARYPLAAPESGQSENEGADLAIDAAGKISGARPLKRRAQAPYDAILETIREHQFDLVIVPCPFGRSFETIGADSAGTVMDVMLSRCPIPMMISRRDDQLLSGCRRLVSVIVGGECDVEAKAASWAFGLVADGGEVELNLVIEKEAFQNFRAIFEAIQPGATIDEKQLGEALAKTHHALHGAMAKTASNRGLTYRLMPQAGQEAPPNLMDEKQLRLLVLPLEVDDRFGQGFVQDRIRRSPHPVLVVPSHVPKAD